MLNIVVAHTKNIHFFHTIIDQQSLDITITFFIHTGLIGGHNPGPVNLGVSHCSNSIV